MKTESNTLRNGILFGGFAIAVTLVIYIWNPSPLVVKITSDVFPFVLSFTSAILAYLILRRQVKNRQGTRVWRWMTLGLILWTAGEAIWSLYELVLQQDVPYPSAADVMWIVGYLPLILALAFQYRSLRASVSRSGKIFIVGLLLVMTGLVLGLVVVPILTDPESGTTLEMFFSLAYPIGDLILVGLASALVLILLGGQLVLSWTVIAAGILMLSVSDLLFSYGTWNGLYYPDGQLNFLSGLFDVLYIAADVIWVVGLYLRFRRSEPGREIGAQREVLENRGAVSGKEKDFLLMTDSEGRVVFIDPALVPVLGLKNPAEARGKPFGLVIGLDNLRMEEAIRKAKTGGASELYPIPLGSPEKGYQLRAVSLGTEASSGFDIILHPEKQAPEPKPEQGARWLEQIVQRALEQEKSQRATGEEDPLQIYCGSIIGLLDVLVSQAGGTGVATAFESILNEKARKSGCAFEIHAGNMAWNAPTANPECCQALLDEAIRYSKSVVATKTIDRRLQEIEQYMPSRIVQAAEENRLRMVRWLEEKPE